MSLQNRNFTLMRQQGSTDDDEVEGADDAWLPDSGAPQPVDAAEESIVVSLSLALQGPAATAWQLATDAKCAEEQIDAVAPVALSMQKRFDTRPDTSTHLLPVATATGNHRLTELFGWAVVALAKLTHRPR